jgi:hypothetical protein
MAGEDMLAELTGVTIEKRLKKIILRIIINHMAAGFN